MARGRSKAGTRRSDSRTTRSSATVSGQSSSTRNGTKVLPGAWPFILIALSGLVVYANALGHPFLFDDIGTITNNPTIRSIAGSLAGGPPQLPTAGRPLVNLTFALNYALAGTSPWGYHATNLAIHICCALLVLALLRRLFVLPRLAPVTGVHATGLAASAALIWVVHPLTSEIVNYATQRTEALMALAYLSTVYCGVRAATDDRSTAWSIASVAACVAGMACKESMVTAPVMMLVLDAVFISDGVLVAIRRRPLYYAALGASLAVLALLIIEGPRSNSAGFGSGVSAWTYLLHQGPVILRYLRYAVLPVGLVLDYGEPTPIGLASVWLPLLGVASLVLLTLAAWRWSRSLAIVGICFFITLSPTSSVVPIATEVGADRRMYLPLIALCALAVVAVWRFVLSRTAAKGMLTVGVAAVFVVALSAATFARNREYDTGIRIWQTSVDRHPTGRAHYNLGLELKAAGERDAAIREYQAALTSSPQAHYAWAFELAADGRHDEAIEHYRTFIQLRPLDADVPRAYHQIGRSYLTLRRPADAATAFRDVLARRRGDADALGGLADAQLAMEKWVDAIAGYDEFLRHRPDDASATFNRGLALVSLDRDAEAADAFATFVRLRPQDVGGHVNLAYALANTGKYGESVREFRRAAELETDPQGKATIEAAIAQLMGAH